MTATYVELIDGKIVTRDAEEWRDEMMSNELIGTELDAAVARALGRDPIHINGLVMALVPGYEMLRGAFSPSTDWSQGGPIIERENLCVGRKQQADTNYCEVNDPAVDCWARTTAGGYLSYGPTPLIAVMRCYVASKLGEVVKVPQELL